MEQTTQQVSSEKKKADYNRNPTGKGGFGDNPSNRNPGGWKPENTISYQYKRFMNMTEEEMRTWLANKDKATMAEQIAYAQVNQARNGKGLLHAKEITDRVEGKAKETVIWDGRLDANVNVEGLDDGTLTSRIRDLVKPATGAEAGSDHDSGRVEPTSGE